MLPMRSPLVGPHGCQYVYQEVYLFVTQDNNNKYLRDFRTAIQQHLGITDGKSTNYVGIMLDGGGSSCLRVYTSSGSRVGLIRLGLSARSSPLNTKAHKMMVPAYREYVGTILLLETIPSMICDTSPSPAEFHVQSVPSLFEHERIFSTSNRIFHVLYYGFISASTIADCFYIKSAVCLNRDAGHSAGYIVQTQLWLCSLPIFRICPGYISPLVKIAMQF